MASSLKEIRKTSKVRTGVQFHRSVAQLTPINIIEIPRKEEKMSRQHG